MEKGKKKIIRRKYFWIWDKKIIFSFIKVMKKVIKGKVFYIYLIILKYKIFVCFKVIDKVER